MLDSNIDFKQGKCLFGAVKLTSISDPDEMDIAVMVFDLIKHCFYWCRN